MFKANVFACAVLIAASPSFAEADPPATLPDDFRRILDRPVASHLYSTPQKSRQRATVWEHMLQESDIAKGVLRSTSVIIVTCGWDRNPTNTHRVAWTTRAYTGNYPFTEESSWDVVYHPENKKIYLVQLLTLAAARSYTLNVYDADHEDDLLKIGLNVLAPATEKRPTPEPIGTLDKKIPYVSREPYSLLLRNPRISIDGQVMTITVGNAYASKSISNSFDLSSKKWVGSPPSP